MTAQLNVPVGYSQDLEARILELPLTARRMSMFLILPDHLDPGIHQMEANFTTHHIKALMATLQVSCCIICGFVLLLCHKYSNLWHCCVVCMPDRIDYIV